MLFISCMVILNPDGKIVSCTFQIFSLQVGFTNIYLDLLQQGRVQNSSKNSLGPQHSPRSLLLFSVLFMYSGV